MVVAGPFAAPRRAAALAAAVALTASGCGVLKASEPDAIAQPGTVTTAPSGLRPGPYALTTDEGAVITFDLPTVPAPDDEVEQLRRDLNVEPVTYVELHIDNTEGTRTVQIDDLKVISHEGGQFPFEPAAEVLSDWDPNRSGEGGFWGADGSPLDAREGARLDTRTHELIAQYTGAVPVGAKGRELMIGDFENLPRSFDDVELSPYPNDRAQDPAPVGHGPEQRQYRAGAPSPAPRERLEAEPAPEPARPAAEPPRVPAAPVTAEPAPAPVPEPAPPQQPVDPVDPPPPMDPVVPVEPTPPPTPTPTPTPTVTPPPGASIPPAENPDTDEDVTGGGAAGGVSASPTPTPTPTMRRYWPLPMEPAPTPSVSTTTPEPTPAPTPSASIGAPSSTPSPTATPAPSSSLPSGAELA
ncbi:hypothetical protein GCM10009696_32320 [Kocuria himachalensis]